MFPGYSLDYKNLLFSFIQLPLKRGGGVYSVGLLAYSKFGKFNKLDLLMVYEVISLSL